MRQPGQTQQILFDLDDTLIYCNKYFMIVIDQFLDLTGTWFQGYDVTVKQIRDKQVELDVAGLNDTGFVSDHFPQSFVMTYRHFCDLTGRSADRAEEAELWKLGRSVYDQPVEAYPGMTETLSMLLEAGHELHLYTGGEADIQQRKIDRLGLAAYFGDRMYIRQHKNADALERILSEGRFDRSRTWMIGNSLRTDVAPALQAGIHAIHFKQAKEWKYNVIEFESTPEDRLFTVTALEEVPGVIESYLKRHGRD